MEAMKSNEYSLSAARAYASKKFGCASCPSIGRCYQHGGEECNLCEGGDYYMDGFMDGVEWMKRQMKE